MRETGWRNGALCKPQSFKSRKALFEGILLAIYQVDTDGIGQKLCKMVGEEKTKTS